MSLKAGFPRLCREQVQPVAGCSQLLPPPHPSRAPCTSETQTQWVRFYLLKYFQKHWIFVFQDTGVYLTGRVKIIWITIAMCKKCSHPQKDLILFTSVTVSSENMDTFLKHNIHLQFKNSALNHRAEAVHC